MKFERIFVLLAVFYFISLTTCERLNSNKHLRRQILQKEESGYHRIDPLPGQAMDIGVGADGSLWMAGTDFKINRWNYQLQKWDYMNGAGPRVSVGPDGKAWVIGTDKKIYAYNGSGWTFMNGAGLDIARGARAEDAFVIGVDNAIYKWSAPYYWGSFTNTKGKKIAVDPNGNPWIIDMNDKVLKYNNGQWQDMKITASEIFIDQYGTTYISSSNTFYTWYEFGQTWVPVRDLYGSNIAVDSSRVYYVVGSSGDITRIM